MSLNLEEKKAVVAEVAAQVAAAQRPFHAGTRDPGLDDPGEKEAEHERPADLPRHLECVPEPLADGLEDDHGARVPARESLARSLVDRLCTDLLAIGGTRKHGLTPRPCTTCTSSAAPPSTTPSTPTDRDETGSRRTGPNPRCRRPINPD